VKVVRIAIDAEGTKIACIALADEGQELVRRRILVSAANMARPWQPSH
jgi:hypothetical protein